MTINAINYHDRLFRAVKTDGGGDVGSDTLFRYEQVGNRLMATYSGGEVEYGTMVGTVSDDGSLSFLYHHRTRTGELRAGHCESRPEILPNRRIRLYESWIWTYGPDRGRRGQSIVEEV
jgi:hypothetical protein